MTLDELIDRLTTLRDRVGGHTKMYSYVEDGEAIQYVKADETSHYLIAS